MNSNIVKGKREYDDKNFKKAVEYFDRVSSDDGDYLGAALYKINALMELKEYSGCLKFINSLIEESPYDELLWYEKVRCHIFLKQKIQAFDALKEFERLVDGDDKYFTLSIARFYELLGDSYSALIFCNKAIALDGNYEEAFYEKAQIATRLQDHDLMVECGEKLIEFADGDVVKLMLPFMLNLYADNYQRSYEIVAMMGELDEEHCELLKYSIYQNMLDDWGVEIRTDAPVEWHVDEALRLLFQFGNYGVDKGVYGGVSYMIL